MLTFIYQKILNYQPHYHVDQVRFNLATNYWLILTSSQINFESFEFCMRSDYISLQFCFNEKFNPYKWCHFKFKHFSVKHNIQNTWCLFADTCFLDINFKKAILTGGEYVTRSVLILHNLLTLSKIIKLSTGCDLKSWFKNNLRKNFLFK